ncbi:MAG: discoidin domain-containing protein [Hespellia sp.]|nr:discoidin domain-containing protein [Hespellia sp.]
MRAKKWATKMLSGTLAFTLCGGLVLAGMKPLTAEAAGNDWENVQEILSRYHGEWDNQDYEGALTDRMPHTALLGNGDVGVTSYGTKGEKTYLISKSDFWNYNGAPLPVGGITIRKARDGELPENKNLTQKIEAVTAGNHFNEFAPERTISGYTKGMEGWVTNPGKEQWIAYQFSEKVTIGHWILVGDGGSRGESQQANNPKDFRMEISDDGNNWMTVDMVAENHQGIVDHYLVTPVQTTYVRFYFTSPTQESDDDSRNNPRARVAQVYFYEDNAPAANVSKGENLAQSRSDIKASSIHENFTPDRAIDGTFIYGNEGWVTGVERNPWIALKFDEQIQLGYYEMMGDSAIRPNGSEANNPHSFRVQTSNDDAVWDTENPDAENLWTTVATVTDNANGMMTGALDTPVSAKYVRIYFDQAVQSADEPNPRARIGRLELYEQAPATSVDGDGSGVYEGSAPGEAQPDSPFQEQMNLSTADVDTSMSFGESQADVNTWIAEGENLLVTKITVKPEMADVNLEISTWAKSDNPKFPATVKEENGVAYVSRQTEKKNDAGAYVSEVAMATRIIGTDVTNQEVKDDKKSVSQYVTLKAGETIYVVTGIGGGGQTYQASDMSLIGENPVTEAGQFIQTAESADAIQTMREAHDTWWSEYWSRSYADFGTDDENLNQIQSYYYGSLYLLGSALRADGIASGLYGIWHTTDSPTWSSDYHLNYNFISAYYGLNSSNRAEFTLPAGQALLDYMPEGQARAERTDQLRRIIPEEQQDFLDQKISAGEIDAVNGISGAILYPVGIGPFGTTPDDNYHREGMNAAYSIYPMIEYYEYTQDKEYLENNVYEYMKKCATFYEKWLVKEEQDGSYTYNIYAGYNEGSWSKNPAVELSVVKNLFSQLLKYSDLLGRDSDKQDIWKDILTHLPKQPTVEVNGKSVLALASEEWRNGQWNEMESPIPGDGNAIPLDAMIPGNVFNHFSSPEDLDLVKNTIQTFIDNGNPWDQNNNFPRIFPEAVESGFDVQTVVNGLADVLRNKQQKNLAVDDGAHGIEKAGSIETVNQMLLNSENDMIEVFPNWLDGKSAQYHNLGAKGGFTVSASYDGAQNAVNSLEVTSKNGKDCRLISPWGKNVIVKDADGNLVKSTKEKIPYYSQIQTDENPSGYYDGTLVCFQTESGKAYHLEVSEESDVTDPTPNDPKDDPTQDDGNKKPSNEDVSKVDPSNTNKNSKNKKAVKTGDATQIFPFIVLAGVSLVVLVGVGVRRRKL